MRLLTAWWGALYTQPEKLIVLTYNWEDNPMNDLMYYCRYKTKTKNENEKRKLTFPAEIGLRSPEFSEIVFAQRCYLYYRSRRPTWIPKELTVWTPRAAELCDLYELHELCNFSFGLYHQNAQMRTYIDNCLAFHLSSPRKRGLARFRQNGWGKKESWD